MRTFITLTAILCSLFVFSGVHADTLQVVTKPIGKHKVEIYLKGSAEELETVDRVVYVMKKEKGTVTTVRREEHSKEGKPFLLTVRDWNKYKHFKANVYKRDKSKVVLKFEVSGKK